MPVTARRAALASTSLALAALLLTSMPAHAQNAASMAPLPAANASATAPEINPAVHEHRHPHVTPLSTLAPVRPLAAAAAGLARPYGGTKIDVLDYHYDNNRTGWNPTETDLTPATVGSSQFGLLTTLAVDGNVFAQPLLATAIKFADGTLHDVLVIATGHDSIYAYDANSYALLWQVSLGTPQKTADVGCEDVRPEYGISSTPVIVRGANNAARLYVVAATEPSRFTFQTQLHALNLADGKDVIPPVSIAPSATLSDGSTLAFDPQNQWSRSSLGTRNGFVYVSIGSHCDNNSGSISGWELRYDSNLALRNSFHTILTPHGGTELASIWMSGFAPAIDAKGDVFAVTGNGDSQAAGHDWGESALRLSPTLAGVTSRFTPSTFNTLNNGDQDFGSGGIMLLPPVPGQTVPPLAVAIGKSAVLYLLDQDKLGGLRTDDSGALQATPLSSSGNSGVWGGPAYYNGPNGPTVFLQTDHAELTGFKVTTVGTPALTATTHGTTVGGYGGTLPIVSSNGATAGTGVVWMLRRSAPIELEAYDAATLGAPIFHAQISNWSNPNQNSFLTPIEANGRVYAPGYKIVRVFGLQ